MRKILIVGGGQSGLQLALCLLEHGYDVTVMTVHTPEELYDGRAVSIQILYDAARKAEREYKLNFWEDEAPRINEFRLSQFVADSQSSFGWTGRLGAPAQSVDERVKMSAWLDLFESRGGKVVIHGATASDLDYLAGMYDLTVVAAGQSGLADMFPVDPSWETARMPELATAIAYIEDSADYPDQNGVGGDTIPGVSGAFVSCPTYSVHGRCRVLFLSTLADGPLRDWPRRCSPQDHLDRMLALLREYVPHRYETYRNARLVGNDAVAMDYTTPLVRHPVARTPSGGLLLGMGDTVVVTSPSLQQDANNASKAAEIYLNAILEQGEAPFDEAFMHRAFSRFMDYAQHFAGEVTARLFSSEPYIEDLVFAASRHQGLADRFANGFNDPQDLATWFTDEAATRALIAQYESGAG
ncbi:styrene monooxygenase/indole monooxygenase family protein [Salinactinospora qingdaonensis]|uniref:Alanine-phosphoribitol ligase n=1 Tax=Salinactinospora qingdaonensis TaxID=702744 RepID=A0ABP7FGX6_9ACTN